MNESNPYSDGGKPLDIRVPAEIARLMDQVPAWATIVDPNERLLLWNREAARISGYDASDVLGESAYWDHLFPAAPDRETAQALFRGHWSETDSQRSDELTILCRDGSSKTLVFQYTPIRGIAELAGCHLTIGFDATHAAQVRDEAQRLAALAMLTHEVALLVGAQTDLSKLLPAIVQSVYDAFPDYGVALLLIDETREWLVLEASAGREGSVPLSGYRLPITQGMTGRAVRTGETQVSGRVEEDPDFIREAITLTQSELSVPLRQDDEIIGVLDMQSSLPQAFDAMQVGAIEAITPHISASILRARLLEQASNRAMRLAVVNRIARAVGSRLDQSELYETVYDELNAVFANEVLFIALYDEDASEFTIEYGKENGEILTKIVAPLGDGLTSHVIRTRKPLHIRNMTEELERGEIPSPKTTGDLTQYESWIGVPMMMGDRVLGVIAVMTESPGSYSAEQVELLFTIADQVAVALENATLYRAAQQELHERQLAEAQVRRHAKELADANEEIKQFAYIVSHDLRAPLVNLKGFASELRTSMKALQEAATRGIASLPESEQQEARYALEEDIPEALGFIETSVTRMDGFINAVLKLSRLGRKQLAFEPVNPAEIVDEVRESLAHQLEAASATLNTRELPTVTADRTSVEQILGNLITNAVVYLEPSRPGRITVGGETRDGETLFWVEDNGRGIAERDAEKVFAPFRRGGKQDVPGEGMGLSYVRTIVRQHGGRIWFESELDIGTTFYFTIADNLGRADEDGE